MTIKTYRWIRLVLALMAGTTVGVGVILNLPLIPLIVVPVGVGASAVAEAGSGWAKTLGFLALVLAAVNIFGGFLVTQRMLAMYRKKTN